MRPKLQDTRTRILVSRDEQVKTLQRIRRAEAYRRERLEGSISAKNQLADEIKASREKSSKAVVLARLRWKREKAAIREKPDAWASLHAAGSSCASSRAPSGCLNTAFSGDGDVSLASSLAPPPQFQKGEPQPRRRHRQACDRPGGTIQAPASPKLVSQSRLSVGRDEASAHRINDTQREPPRLLPQTAPCSLLCESITDAETGKPLELRRRKWELPQPTRRANTARPRGGGDAPRNYVEPRSWPDSSTELMEGGAWQNLWFGEGEDERCRQTSFSAHVARDGEHEPNTATCYGLGTYGDGRDDQQAPEDEDEEMQQLGGSGVESAGSDHLLGVLRGANTLTDADDGNDSYDADAGGRKYVYPAAELVQSMSSLSLPSSSLGLSSKKRPCTVDGGSCFTGKSRTGDTREASPAPGLQRPQGRCEPLTPRSMKRVLSPFWIPPLQEPPPSLTGSPNKAEGRPRAGTSKQRCAGSDGELRRGNRLGAESGDEELPKVSACGGGEWAAGEKSGASREFSAMLGEATDERVRQNMLHAQEIRDRYLRQVQQMIMDETAEERRRVAALRAAAGHPLRCRRLQLRHDQEREEKRTLISWIRRDIELIVVQKMAALGLIR